ncbi:uncharacterized protein LOC143352259 [Halictus rubicundus]|uniref:uncharacterized protein LOC143352259 n=1 Tax=Halictus rubicundus TaxID=77578 RepID=UPI0040374E5B
MLEIDVKEPVKRSPIQTSPDYGANQYSLQSADAQQLSPEYLSILQQYEQPQPAPPQRRPQPAYARQQQALQQAYYNFRKPTVVPPRPRPQLHPQALAQAEVAAEIQAQIDAQNRAEAIRTARLGSSSPSAANTYQVPAYSQPKLGTFEQELLQLVSANQAQEFKLLPTQPKGGSSAYSQQLVEYQPQYDKPAAAAPQLPEQYHIETSPPRAHQPRPVAAYQSVEQPVQYQAQPAKAYPPSPQYDYAADEAHLKALEQAQAQAQAQAEAQALAFQKVAQAEYRQHTQNALEQIRLTVEKDKQRTALEQIQQGAQVSEAGRNYLQEQLQPKSADAAYRAKVKAQTTAEVAEARKLQHAQEFKAHADAIRHLEAQQRAHLRVQEEVRDYALNFEKHQAKAQALAQAQAQALYNAQLQERKEIDTQIIAISKNQVEGKKVDPNSPVYHYNLQPSSTPSPLLNSYFTNDELQKYQASGSSYVPRSVPKPDAQIETAQVQQPAITQPRQAHKLKLPPTPQSVYVSESGLLKKSPIKSITIEEVDPEVNSRQNYQPVKPKALTLSEEELSALINAGYTVTPVPQTAKSDQIFAVENAAPVGYYTKRQKPQAPRPEYVTYEEVIQRPRKLIRKNGPVLKQIDGHTDASEKVTYLLPLETAFGTRQPPLKQEE